MCIYLYTYNPSAALLDIRKSGTIGLQMKVHVKKAKCAINGTLWLTWKTTCYFIFIILKERYIRFIIYSSMYIKINNVISL